MDSSLACLLFSLFLLPRSLLAQNTNNIMVGSSLTAGDNKVRPWLSPSEDFAFGFHQLEKKDLYLPAIWYNKISTKTIVWYANIEYEPAVAPPRSKLELTADRGLVLTSPQGAEIWKSGINLGEAANGFMNDTGNFILSNSRSEILWESFDYPTDTLLPGQTLERGGQILSSRLTETNFSRGRFQFRLIPDGNAVLNSNNLPTGYAYAAYFFSNTVDSNLSNAGLRVVFNDSGYLYVLRASGIRVLLTPGRVVSAAENYQRVTLNFDGVFVQYSHPKNSTGNGGKWSVIRTMPDNICTGIIGLEGNTPCGFNGVCRLSTDQRPICSCPQRFSLLDPNDPHGGCRPDFYPQFCEENVSNSLKDFDFFELENTDWPTSDYDRYTPSNVEECQNACSEDCFCNVVVFKEGNCWKKKLPLSNGRRDDDFNGKTFIKVRKGNYTIRGPPLLPSPTPSEKKNKDSLVLVVSVLLGGSVLVNFVLSFYHLFFYHKKSKRIPPVAETAAESNLRCFSYKELFIATNGFKEVAGRGSFGIVYKGEIEMATKVPVAVKKLDRIVEEGEKEFRTEVKVIGQTHHKNLVQLVGFCDEGQHRLLVYEFMSNGTLANFLFTKTKINWNQRIQIAFGIARGLVYLHEECSTQIIHCDIKPQNILLDDYYNAKISDFGLAKLLVLDQSQTFTAIRGTKGYVAPEWFRNMAVTVKADVYSFGVLLLEIICGRKCVDTDVSAERGLLIDWAYDCYREGTISALVEDDDEAMNDMKKLERFVMVAIWCIQEDPALRPTMKMVVLMLEGIVQVTAPPCPCPFSTVFS
ncbi:G-type lectin S-receptor-like serine/threonine-protein kinase RLK1 [Manihot esculenta]|uniref:Receptor-like serine/threonine-protein kinase n=1 Tax=Manihot esculenta TaxID=3983 RepID=A0A2C9WFX9_MANES|nr:G-type lectin S-receptor-like serine/threonine-protein kinase RLK1 [Manihot esculenta]OAY58830.1 hypothetical protein MANES_02G210200v8 [Manihot esculenta]